MNASGAALPAAIRDAVARCDPAALFVSELRFALGPAVEADALDAALTQLAASGDLVLVAKSAPDPHLEGADLRIAGRDADAVDATWRAWLREFLANHRCQ